MVIGCGETRLSILFELSKPNVDIISLESELFDGEEWMCLPRAASSTKSQHKIRIRTYETSLLLRKKGRGYSGPVCNVLSIG